MMTIHPVEGYIESLFLAVYDKKVLLLDSGCRSDAPRIEKAMKKKLKRPISQIALAVASHTHPDHAGGAHVLRKRFGTPVAAPKEINKWYAGVSGALQHFIDTMLAHYVAWTQKYPVERLWYKKRLTFDHPLKEGETLPGFTDWKIIETPGHTAHDMVLYHEKSKTLYAADVILKVGKNFRLPFPVSMRQEMRCSLEKLKSLEVEHLLMAHGGSHDTDDFPAIIDTLLEEVERGYPPEMARLKPLERFSPVLKKYYKELQETQKVA